MRTVALCSSEGRDYTKIGWSDEPQVIDDWINADEAYSPEEIYHHIVRMQKVTRYPQTEDTIRDGLVGAAADPSQRIHILSSLLPDIKYLYHEPYRVEHFYTTTV